jgi:hypothetical protein
MKIKNIDTDYSKKVTDRFIELSLNGQIFYNDDLRIFDLFQEKYRPVTITEYAKLVGKPYKTVSRWVEGKKLATIDFGGVTFIIYNANNISIRH